jgi:hypothetical protein
MMFRQYHLTSGAITTTGWIDTPAPLRVGTRLTTKEHGSDVIWAIVRAGRIELKEPPDRRWRVGGLY